MEKKIEILKSQYIPAASKIGVGSGALVLNESNRVLLLQRPFSLETDGGLWSQPGGRLEFGEHPKEAASRLLFQLTGIEPLSLQLLTVHTHMSKHEEREIQWISICYLCTRFECHQEPLEDVEDIRWNWFPLTNLPPSLTYYTSASLEALFRRLRS